MTAAPAPSPPPRYHGRLFGRARELEQLDAALRPGRLVTLTGVGGVGKTRLAAEYARRRAGPVWWVDASAAVAPDDLSRAVLRALGVGESASSSLEAVAEEALAATPGLCVLDNLEQLDPGAHGLVRRWLSGPTGAFLGTSRWATGVLEETEVLVDALATDEAAVELFLACLVEPGAVDRRLVEQIVRRLDRLPLAIELAAGRARVLPLDEVLRRLDAPLQLLRDPARAASRTSSVRHSILASVELLPPHAADALAQAAVFAGPFPAEVGAEIVGHPEATLALLAERRLAQREADRFRLVESVRDWGLGVGLRPEVRARHAAWVVARGRALAAGQLTLAGADADGPEFDEVLRRARSAMADPDAVAAAVSSVAVWRRYLLARWRHEDHLALILDLLPHVPVTPESLHLYRTRAFLCARLGRVDDCLTYAADALRRTRLAGDDVGLPISLNQVLDALCGLGRYEEAAAMTEEAVERSVAQGDRLRAVRLLAGDLLLHWTLARDPAAVPARLDRARALAGDHTPSLEKVNTAAATFAFVEGRIDDALDLVAANRALFPGERNAFTESNDVELEVVAGAVRDGSGRLPTFDAAAARLREQNVPASAMKLTVYAAVLAAAERTPDAPARVAASRALVAGLPPSGQRAWVWQLVRAAAALLGVPEGHDGGAGDSRAPVVVWAERFEALARTPPPHLPDVADPGRPTSVVEALLARAWSVAVERRRAEAEAVVVAAGGDRFRHGGGPWVAMGDRPRLRAVLAALAAHPSGASVDVLARAAWSGERLPRSAAANRVRVAVSALRRLGVPIRWERDRGWSLPPGVRIEPSAPG